MKKIYLYSIILFLILFPINSFSQNQYDFKQFGVETGKYFSAPFHWQKNDFLTLGLVSAATFSLIQLDESINEEFKKINTDNEFWLMEAGRYWGEPIPSLALSGILLVHGITANNNSSKKLGFEIAQSFIYSVSVSSALKIFIGRSRPNAVQTATEFNPFSFSNPSWSLPSGHTTVAFSLSTVLAANTDNNYLKVLAFFPAVLTATSRVYQNHHWTSDVFLGAFIGYITGKYITELHKQNEYEPTINSIPLITLSLNI